MNTVDVITLLAVAAVASPFALYALAVALSDRALSWPGPPEAEVEDAA